MNSASYGGTISRNDSYNNRLQPSSLTATVGSTTLLSLSYNFLDGSGYNNGNVMGITNNLDSTRSFTFTYDQLNRINTAATSSATATYTEDIWGNLYSISLTGSPAWQNGLSLGILTNNQVSGDGYDAAGNMTSDGFYTYAYDAEERQTSAAGVTYKYDGDGKRVEKASSEIYWYGLGSEPLLETDWSGNLQNEYVFLGAQRVARRDASSNVYYYLGDHLGSSRMIFTSSGSKCYDADFGPFGKEAVYTGTCSQNYKFTGKERDTETGNDYFGARFDENNLGRFLSPDPAGKAAATLADPQTWNMYAYVRNSPTTLTDPTGLLAVGDAVNDELATDEAAYEKNIANGNDEKQAEEEAQEQNETQLGVTAVSGSSVVDAPAPTAPPAAVPAEPPPDVPVAVLPLAVAGTAVVISADILITRVTDTVIQNYKDQEKYDATVSVVAVENARALSLPDIMSAHKKGPRPSTRGKHEGGRARDKQGRDWRHPSKKNYPPRRMSNRQRKEWERYHDGFEDE